MRAGIEPPGMTRKARDNDRVNFVRLAAIADASSGKEDDASGSDRR
jgi:hypothetical protein